MKDYGFMPDAVGKRHTRQEDTFTGTGRLDAHSPTEMGRAWTSATGTISGNAAIHTETLGAEQATGTLTVGVFYIITASEVNHFYTGSAIGDYFKATATTGLDANNKVQAITLSSILTLSDLGFSEGRYWFTPKITTAGALGGVVVMTNDSVASTDGLWCYYDDTAGKLQVFKRVAGVDTPLLSTAITYVAGKQGCLVYDKSAGKIWAFYNNAIVGTAQALTDASIINNTWHGIMSTGDASVDALAFASLGYGADLFDPGAGTFESGTYSWVPSAGNTIENDAGQLKITYVNHADGAQLTFRDTRDLNSDLTVGELYRFDFAGRVNSGSNVGLTYYNGIGSWLTFKIFTETDLTASVGYFIAQSATGMIIYQGGTMGAGEIIWLDNLVLKQVQ